MAGAQRIFFSMILAGTLVSSLPGQSSDSDQTPENLVEWKLHYFSPEELADGTSDDTATIANTGVPNLLRYAMGLGPRDSIPPLLSIQASEGRLIVAFHPTVDRPDVSCHLEGSVDLSTWSPIEADPSPEFTNQNSSGFSVATLDQLGRGHFFRFRVDRFTTDSDEDGLLDDQELAWFASVAHDASDDPDQDGLTTEAELAVGRSPHRGVLSDPLAAQAATNLTILTPLE